MRYLGHDRFRDLAHARGALVAFRTAMDYPDAVQRLVVMDGLPVIEHLERLNEASSPRDWMGPVARPTSPARCSSTPIPAVGTVPAWLRWGRGDLWAAFGDRAVVHGMCEDYRPACLSTAPTRNAAPPRQAGDPQSDAACSPPPTTITSASTAIPATIRRPATAPPAAQPPDPLRAPPGRTGAGDELAAALLFFLGPPGSHQAASTTLASNGPSLRQTACQPPSPRTLLMARVPDGSLAVPGSRAAGRQGQASHPPQPSVRPPASVPGPQRDELRRGGPTRPTPPLRA